VSIGASETPTSIRRPFTWLVLAKFFVNMALRLAYPFNTDIARGLGVSLDSVGRAQGLAELTGLVNVGIGHQLDRGHTRRWIVAGVSMAGVGALLLGAGSTLWVFGICSALIACGTALMTTAAQTWIGGRVPYAQRGRVIGVYEASWALALLIGAPAAGYLIDRGSWWWPFVGIGALTIGVVPMLARVLDDHEAPPVKTSGRPSRPPKIEWSRPVFAAMLTSTTLTLGAVVVFASYGAWLKDRHGYTTATISTLTIGLGIVELLGSGSTAAFADRLGKRRSVASGTALMAVAAVTIAGSGGSSLLASAGVIALFGGFEFAYVSQISINSEVGGAARGRFMAVNGAIVTVARAIGAALGTWLYVHSGMTAVALLCVGCAVIAAVSVVSTFE
jgi:MFS transporter, DHA1 family, inner membrane transport protein